MNVDGHKVSYLQNFRIIESSFFLVQLSFLCIRAHNDHSPHKTGSLQISIVCTRDADNVTHMGLPFGVYSVQSWTGVAYTPCSLVDHTNSAVESGLDFQNWFSPSLLISSLVRSWWLYLESAFPTISDAFPSKTFKQKLWISIFSWLRLAWRDSSSYIDASLCPFRRAVLASSSKVTRIRGTLGFVCRAKLLTFSFTFSTSMSSMVSFSGLDAFVFFFGGSCGSLSYNYNTWKTYYFFLIIIIIGIFFLSDFITHQK